MLKGGRCWLFWVPRLAKVLERRISLKNMHDEIWHLKSIALLNTSSVSRKYLILTSSTHPWGPHIAIAILTRRFWKGRTEDTSKQLWAHLDNWGPFQTIESPENLHFKPQPARFFWERKELTSETNWPSFVLCLTMFYGAYEHQRGSSSLLGSNSYFLICKNGLSCPPKPNIAAKEKVSDQLMIQGRGSTFFLPRNVRPILVPSCHHQSS